MKTILVLTTLALSTMSFARSPMRVLNPEIKLEGKKAEALYNALDVKAQGRISITLIKVVAKTIPGVECVSVTKTPARPSDSVKVTCLIEQNLGQEQLENLYTKLNVEEVEISRPGATTTTKTVASIEVRKVDLVIRAEERTYYELKKLK